MKSALIIILISFLTISLQAQTFDELIKSGDNLYDEEKYLESAKEYQKAFEIKEGSSLQCYNAACSWALTGDTIEAMKYLSLSADKGWKNLKHVKKDKDLLNLHSVQEWSQVLDKVQANLEVYEKDFDKPLKVQIEKIYVRDQMLRQLYRDAEEKFGKESEEMNFFLGIGY